VAQTNHFVANNLLKTLAAAILIVAGCQTPHRLDVDAQGAPKVQVVKIKYDVKPSFLPEKPARVRLVSDSETIETESVWTWETARLSVMYPATKEDTDVAMVTTRFIQTKEAQPTPRRRVLLKQLLIPRRELDLLLVDLAHSGFFENQVRTTGDAHLNVVIDEGEESKTWSAEPRLNELIDRVYREGRLVDPAATLSNSAPKPVQPKKEPAHAPLE